MSQKTKNRTKRFTANLKKNSVFYSAAFVVFLLLIPLYYRYYQRIGAFGCFDDCHTIVSGYFMTRGRTLYSEIFYNHQLIMPFVSFLIQSLYKAKTLYQLILVHRLFIYGFQLVILALLTWRFRWVGLTFILLYEPIKFYFLGDRFLPEALVPYLAAFLIGIVWERFNKKLNSYDYYISAVLAWLIVFLREPYIPLGLLLFLLITFNRKITSIKWKPVILFLTLSCISILAVPIKDYINTVFVLNSQTIAASELSAKHLNGIGIFKPLFYPITILLTKPITFLGQILAVLNVIFIFAGTYFAVKFRKIALLLIILIVLATAGVRLESPGYMFYEAFHMAPWYGVFIMSIALLLTTLVTTTRQVKVKYIVSLLVILISSYSLFGKGSFVLDNVNSVEEFSTGFSRYQQYANAINTFSSKDDTFYVELWDDIMYWLSGLDSSYHYALFTPWIESTPKYADARKQMFLDNPPDIYYCSEEVTYNSGNFLPEYLKPSYKQVFKDNVPLCLYISNNTVEQLSADQLKVAAQRGYSLNQNSN